MIWITHGFLVLGFLLSCVGLCLLIEPFGNVVRRAVGLLGLANVVWTEDMDGAVRLRLAHKTQFGTYTVKGIWSDRSGKLATSGVILDGSYMERWKPYRLRADMRHWLSTK